MRPVMAFVATWVTASLLLLWLGDYNMYVKFPSGSMIKEQAGIPQRLISSALFGALFSLVNTGVLWGLERFSKK
jgi:hypothetical protein